MNLILKLAAVGIFASTAVFAQTAAPANPLKAAPPSATMPAAPAVKVPTVKVTPEATAEKPKRARSEKQKANDDLMRKCGAEWRADKAAGKTGSTTWREYLPKCRAKMKAA